MTWSSHKSQRGPIASMSISFVETEQTRSMALLSHPADLESVTGTLRAPRDPRYLPKSEEAR